MFTFVPPKLYRSKKERAVYSRGNTTRNAIAVEFGELPMRSGTKRSYNNQDEIVVLTRARFALVVYQN